MQHFDGIHRIYFNFFFILYHSKPITIINRENIYKNKITEAKIKTQKMNWFINSRSTSWWKFLHEKFGENTKFVWRIPGLQLNELEI